MSPIFRGFPGFRRRTFVGYYLFMHRLSAAALFLIINFLLFSFRFAFKHIDIMASRLDETKSINILLSPGLFMVANEKAESKCESDCIKF